MPAVPVYTGPVLENTGEPSHNLVWLLTGLIFDPTDGVGSADADTPAKPLL